MFPCFHHATWTALGVLLFCASLFPAVGQDRPAEEESSSTRMPVLSRKYWRPVCQAQMIAVGVVHVPVEEIEAAAKENRHRYVKIRVSLSRKLRGSLEGGSLELKYYTRQTFFSPAPRMVMRANGKKAVLFLVTGRKGEWFFLRHAYALCPGTEDGIAEVEKEIAAQKKILSDLAEYLPIPEDDLYRQVKACIKDTQLKEKASTVSDRLLALGKKAIPAMIRLMDNRRDLLVQRVTFKAPAGHWEGLTHYSPKKVVDLCDAVLNRLAGFGGSLTNGGTETARRAAVRSWRIYLYWKRHPTPAPPELKKKPAPADPAPAEPAIRFFAPKEDKDQHGNPVVTRNGLRADPKTGKAYELWMLKPRIEFVLIPAGSFVMGAGKDVPKAGKDEQPAHKVRITRPFYLAKYEITQGQWKAVMKFNPAHFKASGLNAPVESGNDPYAYLYVSWYNAKTFCRHLGLALPTEAQWEYACRGGGTARPLAETAWFHSNAKEKTHPVGRLRPNGFGIYDMLGNVCEWCEDVYDEKFYSTPAALKDDPVFRSGKGARVFRGGAWCFFKSDLSVTNRGCAQPGFKHFYIGLRPVLRIHKK